jgi:hypothetical protein
VGLEDVKESEQGLRPRAHRTAPPPRASSWLEPSGAGSCSARAHAGSHRAHPLGAPPPPTPANSSRRAHTRGIQLAAALLLSTISSAPLLARRPAGHHAFSSVHEGRRAARRWRVTMACSVVGPRAGSRVGVEAGRSLPSLPSDRQWGWAPARCPAASSRCGSGGSRTHRRGISPVPISSAQR